MEEGVDAIKAEQISQLAKSMKDLHLVATMEEAFQRAKEIILGSSKEAKSAKEALNEVEQQ